MKYMGSKRRIAKDILQIILKDRKEEQWYIEPFVGGANIIDKVDGLRIGSDVNRYLIALFKAVIDGWNPPEFIERDKQKDIVNNKDLYSDELVGWASIACSYSGSGSGYAGLYPKSRARKDGTIPSYQLESWNSLKKQIPNLKDIIFLNKSYDELDYPNNSIIYCDPPYENTAKYKDVIDHKKFWQWVRDMTKAGHQVFVSEYNAPEDFTCIWQKELKSSLGVTKQGKKAKDSVEKLFVYKPNTL